MYFNLRPRDGNREGVEWILTSSSSMRARAALINVDADSCGGGGLNRGSGFEARASAAQRTCASGIFVHVYTYVWGGSMVLREVDL